MKCFTVFEITSNGKSESGQRLTPQDATALALHLSGQKPDSRFEVHEHRGEPVAAAINGKETDQWQ